jgi:hypothetical protein
VTQQEKAATAFRQWVRDHVSGQPECKAPEVARAALAEFKRGPVWDALVGEMEYQLAYRLTLEAMRAGRVVFADGESVRADRESLQDSVTTRTASVFADWKEYIGDRHVSMLDMDRTQVDAALDIWRKNRAVADSRIRFYEAIRKGLKGGKTIRQTYTESQLLRKLKSIAPTPVLEAAD